MGNYLYCGVSDIGIEKEVNQDSFLIKEIHINDKPAVFGFVCDGLGGLSFGEKASASVCKRFRTWFIEEFPYIVNHPYTPDDIFMRWSDLILQANQKLLDYGKSYGIRLGTTISGILIYDNNYYVINVGDSRVYMIDEQLKQLTKDQSLIQKEIDAGRLTEEEAKVDERQNVILECIGAKKTVNPAYYYGNIKPMTSYIFCSDGFRHELSNDEIFDSFHPCSFIKREELKERITKCVEIVKERGEVDNITVGVIKVCN